jgi:two-component system, OmpR family, phosphate regulon sensor histidine kinase PhoR
MFTSPYLWRTAASYILFILAGVGLLALRSLGDISQDETARSEQELHSHAFTLAAAVAQPLRANDIAGIDAIVDALASSTGLRATLIDSDGVVLADTLEDPASMDNHLHRPEVQTAINRGEGRAQRFSQTLQENYNYVAVPVTASGTLLGVARVARSQAELEETILANQLEELLSAVGIIVLLAALALVVAWRKAAVMEEITQITEAIAQGDFERRVAESKAVGMKRLADAINQMARNSARRVSLLTSDRNRLATVFTGMVEGVIDVDQKQNTIHINEAAAAMLGVEREKCIGKPVWHVTRHQKITQALDEALRQRSVIKTQVDYPLDNNQLVMDIYVASLSDDQGEAIGAVVVLHNITELKNLERVRTDFVANASHELKTPITAIRGLSETVVGDPDMDKAMAMHFMERIHSQSIRLSHLVTDLMTISRLESDQNAAEFTLLNFGELVNRALAAAETAIENKHHKLTATLPSSKVEVVGDRQQLSQLVDNLLDNAIKYTPEGGHIKVRVSVQGAEMILEVEDTGIGISPQYQQRVFERFYRVDKARSQSMGGTGLGLSIVKNIAERHNGVVSVSSQLGRGSTFVYRMACAQHDKDYGKDLDAGFSG